MSKNAILDEQEIGLLSSCFKVPVEYINEADLDDYIKDIILLEDSFTCFLSCLTSIARNPDALLRNDILFAFETFFIDYVNLGNPTSPFPFKSAYLGNRNIFPSIASTDRGKICKILVKFFFGIRHYWGLSERSWVICTVRYLRFIFDEAL